MGILNWVKGSIIGRNESKRRPETESTSQSQGGLRDPPKEEHSQWSHGFLAIGTLGNIPSVEDSLKNNSSESSCAIEDMLDMITVGDLSKLENALTKLLSCKTKSESRKLSKSIEGEDNLPLDRFLNCPSSLGIDRRLCQVCSNDVDSADEVDALPEKNISLKRVKDVFTENGIVQKLRPFLVLLKKVFNHKGRIVPNPMKDQQTESSVEKMLKAILRTSICNGSSKNYSEKECMDEKNIDHQKHENKEKRFRWIKTDSEYIVLEI